MQITADESARDWFSKPGDSMRYHMRAQNLTLAETASRTDLDIRVIHGIIAGTVAIDQKIAHTLAASLGGTPSFWLKRQEHYDRDLDRVIDRALDDDVDERLREISLPAEMHSTKAHRRTLEALRKRLVFYDVNGFDLWDTKYGRVPTATSFRTSRTYKSVDSALALWLREGEIQANFIQTRPWCANELRAQLPIIRGLSRISQPNRFIPKLRDVCANAGVALAIVKAPNGCRASGASRFVAPDKAMVLLSFRHRSDDQFWFTVFHEIAHLLLHRRSTYVNDENTSPDEQYEKEANEFARLCIVPSENEADFKNLRLSYRSITRFSVSIGVAPGLIVGQLQHNQTIRPNQFNRLKRHWKWSDIDSAIA